MNQREREKTKLCHWSWSFAFISPNNDRPDLKKVEGGHENKFRERNVWSKLGSGLEKLVCTSPQRIPRCTKTLLLKIIKQYILKSYDERKVKYKHIDDMESQLQISVLFRWLYRDKKVFSGLCEYRTHDLGVISTALYQLSQQTTELCTTQNMPGRDMPLALKVVKKITK